ncbi:hypothetical protein [Kangiella sp.]|uniref:hypothetical protein n=1 Tax=Kangiella sp. TaxID=1920245 RepID=UPI0019873061|nr:hypothetical protein [Kangiella sp.]MBD3654105.1 hypothetical protein [Kangiella sp.]
MHSKWKLVLALVLLLLFSKQAFSKEDSFEQRDCKAIAQDIINSATRFSSESTEISNGVFYTKSNVKVKINYSNNKYQVECSKAIDGRKDNTVKVSIDVVRDT